ncbi:MAG: hypothetical protein AB7P49_00325 [Bdellovibrionales bacterium]
MTKAMQIMEELTSKIVEMGWPNVPLASSKLDAQTIRDCLKQSLTLYLLTNSQLPVCVVIEDIFDLEIEVGNCIARVLSPSEGGDTNLRGILANTLSVMPLGGQIGPALSSSTNSTHADT